MSQNLYDLVNSGNLLDINYLNVNESAQIGNTLIVVQEGQFLNDVYVDGPLIANGNNFINGQTIFSNNVYFDDYTEFTDTVIFSNTSTAVVFDGNVITNSLFQFSNVGNIIINGGNNGDVLTTYGNGLLYWGNGGGGGNASFIANGTSNVSIPSANGNVLISAAGNANVVIITGSEFRVNNKIANLGNVANVEIGGGNYGWILGTGGSANLAWIPGPYSWVTNYGILSGAPAYANATANRNEPLIYVGADPGANYVWPWYQNTSTTGNGYAANSTGTLTPANAAILTGNLLSNTITGGWYKLTETTVNDSNTYYVSSITTLRTYANTTNVEFQIVPYVGYTGNNNVALQTNKLETYLVTNDAPATFVATSFYSYYNNANYDVTGYYIRNITASSELTVVTCEQEVLLHI